MVQIQYRPPERSHETRWHIHTPADTRQPSLSEIRALIADALPEDAALRPLAGFKLDFAANPGFRKVFFAARCDCGTAGLLSVEVSPDKTVNELRQAAPELARRLLLQAKSFHAMPCKMHAMMRMGPAASAGKAREA